MDTPELYTHEANVTAEGVFIFYINDIPVLRNQRGGSLSTKLYIDRFLQNGTNQIRAELIASSKTGKIEDTSKVNVAISSITKGKTDVVASLESSMGKPDTTSEFLIKSSFKSALLSGLKLENTETLKKELFQKYLEIKNYLAQKNITEVLRLFSKRHYEMAMLTNSDLLKYENEAKTDYSSYVNLPDFTLFDFQEEKVFLKIYGNGKLASLEVKNGNQPLCFVNRKDNIAIYIPIYFYRNPENKQLEIIR